MSKIVRKYRHRLLCADSLVKENVDLLMDSEKACLVFCDPPYGINVDTNYERFGGSNAKNDLSRHDKKYRPIVNDDKEFNPLFLLDYFKYVKDIFLWGFNYYMNPSRDHSVVVWDKKTSESLDKMYSGDFELCWSKTKHKNSMCRILWSGVLGHNSKYDGANKIHPTQKPVKLVEWFFEKWGGSVLTSLTYSAAVAVRLSLVKKPKEGVSCAR
jgi:hypothetical protein